MKATIAAGLVCGTLTATSAPAQHLRSDKIFGSGPALVSVKAGLSPNGACSRQVFQNRQS